MTSTETKTEDELKKLLISYRDGLSHWQSQISSRESISELKASKVDHPIEELIKLCQITHANTTKMGLIFTKPLKDINAAYKQTREMSSSSVLLISLCTQLLENGDDLSQLFIGELLVVIKDLLSSLESFISELINDEDDKRLVSVGKIWELVTQITKIAKLGTVGVLKLKLKESTTMISDGIQELETWIENPEDLEDDPFAFSDEDDDDDDLLLLPPSDSTEKEDYSDILPLAKIYLNKIKLVKLLVLSLSKSIPTDVKDKKVDEIYGIIKQFSEFVDELIYKLIFENDQTEAKIWFQKLDKSSDELISILKNVNKKDDKKLKWLDVWQLKFKDI